MSRPSRVLAGSLGAGAAAAFVGSQAAAVRHDGWTAIGSSFASGILLVLFFVGLGVLLALRRPANPIGWLFIAGGWTSLLQGVAAGVAARAEDTGSVPLGARLAAAADSNLWPLAVVCSVGLPLVLFPTGRPRSRRGRALAILLVADAIMLMTTFALTPGPLDDPTSSSHGPINPTGVTALASATRVATQVGLPIFMLCMLTAVGSLIAHLRTSTGAERQQLRWVLTGATLALVGILVVYIGSYLLDLSPGVADVAVTVGTGCVPVTFTVAILRYRLYDLDRLVSRTVTYAAVTGVLAMTYAGLVTAASRLTPATSSLAVASSTLAVAALFTPLRRHVQTSVDRRFNRSRFDAERTVDAFARRLRDQVDLDVVRHELLATALVTMQPATAVLWLRSAELVAT